MYCPKCGTQNDDNDFRCIKCSEVIQPVPIQPRPKVIDDTPVMRMILPVGRSGLAIAAGYAGLFSILCFLAPIAFGYAGLFSILCFPAPIALILGILAVIDIKRHPEKHGMGRAVFAMLTGGLFSALLVLFLLTAVFNLRSV